MLSGRKIIERSLNDTNWIKYLFKSVPSEAECERGHFLSGHIGVNCFPDLIPQKIFDVWIWLQSIWKLHSVKKQFAGDVAFAKAIAEKQRSLTDVAFAWTSIQCKRTPSTQIFEPRRFLIPQTWAMNLSNLKSSDSSNLSIKIITSLLHSAKMYTHNKNTWLGSNTLCQTSLNSSYMVEKHSVSFTYNKGSFYLVHCDPSSMDSVM